MPITPSEAGIGCKSSYIILNSQIFARLSLQMVEKTMVW